MANTFSPFGFRSFGRLEGGAPTAGLTKALILSSDTNSYFTGDTVAYSSAALVAGYITLPASGTISPPTLGVFAGCEYYSPSVGRVVWSSYFPASVGSSSPVTAYVITDPEQRFIAQASTVSLVGSSNAGQNIGVGSSFQSGGNTLSGISGLALNSSTVSANSSLPFRIVDSYANYAPPGVNGTDTTTAGQILVVAPNNWVRNNLTAYST